MDVIRLPGPPPLDVHLRRSARARQLSLRVSGLDGRATLTLPPHLPEALARAFVLQKEGWLRRHAGAAPGRAVPRLGLCLPVLGAPRLLVAGQGRAARLSECGERLEVPGPEARMAAPIGAYLRHLARDNLADATARHAAALGVEVAALSLRDPRARWGSASIGGRLMFSWRLAMAPPEVLDYVAAHEVAHLREMNHSPRFWAVVERLCPDWRTRRDWLRREGAGLHRWDFSSAG